MLPIDQVAIRLVLAAVLGSVVGFERERHDKAAGLRTHMLVSVGSALVMMVSTYGFDEVLGSKAATELDPSRVAAQVVSGIGFLGAGIIIFRRDAVIGLTTAAGIWAMAGVGLAVGGGMYFASIVATALIVAVIWAFRPIERRLRVESKQHTLNITVDRSVSISELEDKVHSTGALVTKVSIEKLADSAECSVKLVLDTTSATDVLTILDSVREFAGVRKVEITS